MQFRHLIISVGAVFALLEAKATSAQDNPDVSNASMSAVEKFKSFIQSPPVISQIIFVEHYPQTDGPFRPKYYEARWQPNAYLVAFWKDPYFDTNSFVESVNTRTGPLPGLAIGKHESFYWSATPYMHNLLMWDDTNHVGLDATNIVADQHETELYPLSLVLNMGAAWSRIESINWNGNTFSCTNYFHNNVRAVLKGQLEVSNGKVRKMLVYHELQLPDSKEPRKGTWEMIYDYPDEEPGTYLPSKMKRFFIKTDGGKSSMSDIEILSLVTTNSPLAEEFFSPKLLGGTNFTKTFSVKNGKVMYLEGTEWKPMLNPDNPRLGSNIDAATRRRRKLFFIISLLLIVPLGWAFWRGQKKEK